MNSKIILNLLIVASGALLLVLLWNVQAFAALWALLIVGWAIYLRKTKRL